MIPWETVIVILLWATIIGGYALAGGIVGAMVSRRSDDIGIGTVAGVFWPVGLPVLVGVTIVQWLTRRAATHSVPTARVVERDQR